MMARVYAMDHYWPAVVAVLYLLYVLAANKTDQVGAAFAAVVAAVGLTHSVASAHAKIDVANGAGKLLEPKAADKS